MRRRSLSVVIAAALALPTGASAAQGPALPVNRPLTIERVTDSMRIAAGYWATEIPCARVYAVDYDLLKTVTRTVSAIGTADPCHIWLIDWLLEPEQRTYEHRIQTCTTIVHEFGHAMGLDHSADRRSIMYPSRASNAVVWGCYKRFMPRGKARAWRNEHGAPVWLGRT